MALPWLLVLEFVLYAGCFICGIMFAAPLTITQGHFTGQCILYGTSPSHPSLCYFVSAISVSVAIYWFYTRKDWLNVTLGVRVKILFFLAVSGTASLSALHNVPSITSRDEADHKTWVSPYDRNQFHTGCLWVNVFFWVLIGAVVFVQKHQGLGSGSEWSTSETEPFFHQPV
uniref:Transmembrane protein 179Bb n=1 Tax=Hucho hucho TaxID=62062 RepID=A0A4W5MUZ8_9TELE